MRKCFKEGKVWERKTNMLIGVAAIAILFAVRKYLMTEVDDMGARRKKCE